MPESPWLVVRTPLRTPTLRVFAVPYAGGNAAVFDPWRSVLPSGVELCAVQLPGRHNRVDEAPPRRMSLLLQGLESPVTARLDKPYLVYGDCQGAITAFELIRRLRRRGQTLPRRLVVSSSEAPHVAAPLPDYAAMDDEAFLADLVNLGLVEPLVLKHFDLVEAMLPTLRADFELAQSYRYHHQAALAVPLTAIRGERDPFVTPQGMRAWADLTTDGFEMIAVEGGHDMLHRSVPTLPTAIRELCETELARCSDTRIPS